MAQKTSFARSRRSHQLRPQPLRPRTVQHSAQRDEATHLHPHLLHWNVTA